MTISFRFYLSLVLCAGGIYSCTDHRLPEIAPGSAQTRLRVKSLTLELPGGTAKVSAFAYDSQGRLTTIKTYQMPDSTVSEQEYSHYSYDGQSRLIQLQHTAILYPRGSQPNRLEQYQYSYNTAGQVATINYLNGFSVSLGYTPANQLASSFSYYAISGLTLRRSESFTFTSSNLTTRTSESNIPSRGGVDPIVTSSTTYTHDNKVNPFYGVFVIPSPYPNGFVNLQFGGGSPNTYFGGIDNVLTLSKNNLLTQNTTSTFTSLGGNSTSTSSSAYEYEYNASDLPLLRRLVNSSHQVIETLHFEYESY